MASADDLVVISGCSGGGKSTLLDALKDLGYHIVKEPGRRIVAEELACGGSALPWADPVAFARRAIRLSLADRATLKTAIWLGVLRQGIDRRC